MTTRRQSGERTRRRGRDMEIEVGLSLAFAAVAFISLAALVVEAVVKAAG